MWHAVAAGLHQGMTLCSFTDYVKKFNNYKNGQLSYIPQIKTTDSAQSGNVANMRALIPKGGSRGKVTQERIELH